MKPIFFRSAAEWRAWLAAHRDHTDEVLVGYYKRATNKPSLTWSESVDEALCFGWIDGIRRRVDDDRYTIRFTPRRPGSTWSAVNLRKIETLAAKRLMQPAGLAAHAARRADRIGYSFEQRKSLVLPPAFVRRFRANPAAWAFFNEQPPGYRRTVTFWIVSAKRQTTQQQRLDRLIAECARRRRVGLLAKPDSRR